MTTVAAEGERAQFVEAIRKLAAADSGVPPGQRAFERAMGLQRTAWYGKYWPRWGDALREAGFTAKVLQPRFDDDAMLAKFAELARHLGHIPTYSEFDLYRRRFGQMPSKRTYREHFGAKPELLERLKLWAAGRPGAGDIAAMIPERARAIYIRNAKINGAIYLLRSGNRFKIGCSRALEKRVRTIRALLPESDLVHSIETDDPRGVEAYWHRRFADKRLMGEWFELSPEDIAAFRKWRTQ